MSQLISQNAMPSGNTPRAEVIRHVMQGIQTGAYGVGLPLPSARQLSRELGVDRGTVGRAFALLEDDGYVRPDKNGIRIVVSAARDESGLVAQSIAVLAKGPSFWPQGHFQPGWGDFLDRGILDQIHTSKLHAISLNPDVLNWDTVNQLLQSRPRGVIVNEEAALSANTAKMLTTLQDGGLPVVAYGNDSHSQSFDRVTSDHKSGANMLTSWLLSQGCRRILMMQCEVNNGSYWVEERIAGYRKAMADAGLPALEPVFLPPMSDGYGKELFMKNTRVSGGYLLEYIAHDPIDAILCPTDGWVFPIAKACQLAGKTPNKDIFVAGYDNYWQDCHERVYVDAVPAVTIDKLNHEAGSEMVKLLMDRLNGKLPDEPQQRFVQPELITIDSQEIQ